MAQSIMRSGAERLSSGGAVLNSVRLSLLLACTAVCAAPGLLPVAGFPHHARARRLQAAASWLGGGGGAGGLLSRFADFNLPKRII